MKTYTARRLTHSSHDIRGIHAAHAAVKVSAANALVDKGGMVGDGNGHGHERKVSVGKRKALKQLTLNFGQTPIHKALECPVCKMTYHRSSNQDRQIHSKYHDTFVLGPNYSSATRDKVITSFDDGTFIVEAHIPSTMWVSSAGSGAGTATPPNSAGGVLEEVMSCIERDLGAVKIELDELRRMRVYYYVKDKRVLGAIVVEMCVVTHPVIYPQKNSTDDEVDYLSTSSPTTSAPTIKTSAQTTNELVNMECEGVVVSKEEVQSLIGISRIWTHSCQRRQGIASKLLTAVLQNIVFGTVVSAKQVAFSQPTALGYAFAKRFCGEVLVYST